MQDIRAHIKHKLRCMLEYWGVHSAGRFVTESKWVSLVRIMALPESMACCGENLQIRGPAML